MGLLPGIRLPVQTFEKSVKLFFVEILVKSFYLVKRLRVEKLKGATVAAHDLRAGAALVIAGLSAEGTTIVENIHFVERGYQNLIEKFTALGADIRRIDD